MRLVEDAGNDFEDEGYDEFLGKLDEEGWKWMAPESEEAYYIAVSFVEELDEEAQRNNREVEHTEFCEQFRYRIVEKG